MLCGLLTDTCHFLLLSEGLFACLETEQTGKHKAEGQTEGKGLGL